MVLLPTVPADRSLRFRLAFRLAFFLIRLRRLLTREVALSSSVFLPLQVHYVMVEDSPKVPERGCSRLDSLGYTELYV
jgi:hypothetical protein